MYTNNHREILFTRLMQRHRFSWDAQQLIWRASLKMAEGKVEEALDLLLEALASR